MKLGISTMILKLASHAHSILSDLGIEHCYRDGKPALVNYLALLR